MSLRFTTRLCLLLAMSCLVLPAFAQYRRPTPPPRTSPRAVAVLEIMPGGSAHLYPVSLMLDGKFYDASLYAAKPVPLALYSETVYEAMKSGMPVGLFTVQRASKNQNSWWGEGRWKPYAGDEEAASKQGPKSEAKSDKAGAKSGEAKKEAPADDPDRPVLKKPKAEAPAEPQVNAGAPSATPGAAEDKRAAREADEDPSRPMLRRGRPNDAGKEEPLPTSPIAGGGLPGKTPAKAAGKPSATYVAVSDAAPYDNRPYDYQAGAAQQEQLTKLASDIAIGEMRKFAAPSGRKLPPVVTLTNVGVHAYDLDYSNSPYIILSGQYLFHPAPTKGQTASVRDTVFYVTVVTRMDIDGKLNKVLAVATDSQHLDAYPQLELIDAIDVDADGRGELLFRQISDTGRSYIVYRVLPFQMTKLFEGGSGQ